MQEKEFVCWQGGQSETQGRLLKALNPEAAARKAMDIWLHEESRNGDNFGSKVFVKDSEEEVHEINLRH